MSNSTEPKGHEVAVERLQNLQLADPSARDAQNTEMKAKLLHHLVDFSRVFKKSPSEREVDEMIKKNSALVNELLEWQCKPAADESAKAIENADVVWQEYRMKKLIDGKVNVADEKVKKFTDKLMKSTSTQIEKLVDAFMFSSTSFTRYEDKATFVIDTRANAAAQPENNEIYLRSLTFDVAMYSGPVEMDILCSGIPAGMACKARIVVTIKNQAGGKDWTRCFSKIFHSALGQTDSQFYVGELIQKNEYDEHANPGLLNDDKLIAEVLIQADELAEFEKPKAQQPALGYRGRKAGRYYAGGNYF